MTNPTNPMLSVFDPVQQELGQDTVRQIGQQIGADENTTQTAISAALPMILGGMAHTASQPGGADSIHRQVDDHAGVLGNLGGILSGAAGGGILGSILGHRQSSVQQGVSQASGLDPHQAGKLLMILAPIVMGVLARRKQQGELDPGQLGSILQQSQQHAEQQAQQQSPQVGGMLGGLMGQIFGR